MEWGHWFIFLDLGYLLIPTAYLLLLGVDLQHGILQLKECLKESFGITEYVYGLIYLIRADLKELFMFLITKVNNDLSSA